MARLIDANSLRRLFDTLSKNKWNKSSFTSWAMAYEAAKAMVDDEVTVDAVPVVRCKDCRYFVGEGMYCENNIIPMFDHFYCYYGERREDGKTD